MKWLRGPEGILPTNQKDLGVTFSVAVVDVVLLPSRFLWPKRPGRKPVLFSSLSISSLLSVDNHVDENQLSGSAGDNCSTTIEE